MENCFLSLVKYLLFLTNFLIFALGVACLGVSIFALVDGSALQDLLSSIDDSISIQIYSAAAIVVIVFSSVVVLISFLGCCGAIKENKCMLMTYIIFVILTVIALIAAAVLGFTQDLESALKKPLLDSMENYGKDNSTTITESWDQLQTEFECCGVNNYTDWAIENSAFAGADKVPASCCNFNSTWTDTQVKSCQKTPQNFLPADDGCVTQFIDSINANEDMLLITMGCIIGAIVVNIASAFAVYCGIKSENYVA